MTHILAYCPSALEDDYISRTLSKAFRDYEIETTVSLKTAMDIVSARRVDLLIADIYIFDANNCEMISHAKEIGAGMPILVTSASDRDYVASNIWRLGVDDFLLKPYRPTWLVAAVASLLEDRRAGQGARIEPDLDDVLAEISGYIDSSCYLKCTEVAKKYLDDIFAREEDKNEARRISLAFVQKVSSLRSPPGGGASSSIEREIARLDKRGDGRTAKYDALTACARIIGLLIDDSGADPSQRVLNFIDRSARRGVSLNEAADFASMSSYYFSKFFKRLTGVNFIAYVSERKMDEAKIMLEETDMPIINIASELSFHETNYFSKAFRKRVGMTPTEYRESKK